jgi:hypothetical protein
MTDTAEAAPVTEYEWEAPPESDRTPLKVPYAVSIHHYPPKEGTNSNSWTHKGDLSRTAYEFLVDRGYQFIALDIARDPDTGKIRAVRLRGLPDKTEPRAIPIRMDTTFTGKALEAIQADKRILLQPDGDHLVGIIT